MLISQKKAPYTNFNKTVQLPIEVYLNGKRIISDTWDEEWFIERAEELYGLNSHQIKNKKIRIIDGNDFRKEINSLRYVDHNIVNKTNTNLHIKNSNQEVFKNSLEYGTEGEREVANIFLDLGYSIMPMYQFKKLDTSPKIFSNESQLISPDLIIFNKNKTLFVEVKKKTKWVRSDGELETGCDYRLYQQYLQIVKTTNINLILVFNHEKEEPNGMYYIDVKTEGRYWNGLVNGSRVYTPMYFFKFSQLKKL
jgi:hypothetical protein